MDGLDNPGDGNNQYSSPSVQQQGGVSQSGTTSSGARRGSQTASSSAAFAQMQSGQSATVTSTGAQAASASATKAGGAQAASASAQASNEAFARNQNANTVSQVQTKYVTMPVWEPVTKMVPMTMAVPVARPQTTIIERELTPWTPVESRPQYRVYYRTDSGEFQTPSPFDTPMIKPGKAETFKPMEEVFVDLVGDGKTWINAVLSYQYPDNSCIVVLHSAHQPQNLKDQGAAPIAIVPSTQVRRAGPGGKPLPPGSKAPAKPSAEPKKPFSIWDLFFPKTQPKVLKTNTKKSERKNSIPALSRSANNGVNQGPKASTTTPVTQARKASTSNLVTQARKASSASLQNAVANNAMRAVAGM